MSRQRNPPCNTPKEHSCSDYALTTYLPHDRVIAVLNDKLADGQLFQAFAIYHDRDNYEDGTPVPPHSHVYVRLARSRMPSQIRNWFRGIDDKGQLVNTFSEPLKGSPQDLRDYFLHKDQPDYKFKYSEADLTEVGDPLTVNEGVDDTYSIFMDLCNSTPIPDLIRKYGRDFVYHYNHWRALMEDYVNQADRAAREKSWREYNKQIYGLQEVDKDEVLSKFETDQ